MNIDPASLSQRDSYQLLISVIVPRPIAFVSTVADDGVLNLAPFSFFTGICAKPPTICFSVVRRRGEKKDTLRNIEATGEFVVNVVSERFAQAMNQTSADHPLLPHWRPLRDGAAEAGKLVICCHLGSLPSCSNVWCEPG